MRSVKEYDLFVPLHFNDGRPIDPRKIAELKHQLVAKFGGLTHFAQENEGLWRIGRVTFRDRIMVLRVLADEADGADAFFDQLKSDLQREWEQADFLIVARRVEVR